MAYTLVALHAHPDDESSKGAATVARYADEGVRCVLVTATGGEAGDILNPALESRTLPADLAAVRRQELAAAVAIIGYHRLVELGYRDSGMPDTDHNRHPDAFVNVPFDEALEAVVRVIREERPQVILGYDDHARYPHPDHLRVHDLGLAAFDAAADPARFPEAGPPWQASRLFAPVFTRARLEALHRAMLRQSGASPLEEWLQRRGDAPDPEAVTSVDVGGHLERARAALRAHRTQVDPDGRWFSVPTDLERAVYPYEDFVLLAATDAAPPGVRDLFAGVGTAQAEGPSRR